MTETPPLTCPQPQLYDTFLEFDRTWLPFLVAKFPVILLMRGIALREKIILAFDHYLNHAPSEDQAIEYRGVHAGGMTGTTPPWSQRDTATCAFRFGRLPSGF